MFQRLRTRIRELYQRIAIRLGFAGKEKAIATQLANKVKSSAASRMEIGHVTEYMPTLALDGDVPVEKIAPLPYALMSAACYGNEAALERLLTLGWRKITDYSEDLHGYDGSAYFHDATGELVFAHQGTTDWSLLPSGDGDDNAQLATQYTDQFTQRVFSEEQIVDPVTAPPGQFSAALEFMNSVQEALKIQEIEVSLIRTTGHSLGGAIADLVAAARGLQAITFDTPGTAEIIRENPLVFPNAETAQHMAWQIEQGMMRHQGNLPGKAAAMIIDDSSDFEELISDPVKHIKTNHDIKRIVASLGELSGFPKRHSLIQVGKAIYTKDQHFNR